MSRNEQRLADSSGIEELIASLAQRISEDRSRDSPIRLIGVRTRGVAVAERIARRLRETLGEDVPVGAVEITLYRDDMDRGDRWPVLRGTEVPFDVEGTEIVLVDDVLYTGRTVRAALNAVCDLGRPSRVKLAVLVDRGHRELPVRADYVGMEVSTGKDDRVRVRVSPIDPTDEIIRITAEGA